MSETVLSVINLGFAYGATRILEDITFTVAAGEYLLIVGPNGGGKTTLAKVILGLLKPYSGTIQLFGRQHKDFTEWGRIGYLPQRSNSVNPLFPARVREVVALGLLACKHFPCRLQPSDRHSVRQALEQVGIADLAEIPLSELSVGQQQRTFIARALVTSPELLFLDEPSTALDPTARETLRELILRLNHERRITVLLITHDTELVNHHPGRVLYLDRKLIYCGQAAGFLNFSPSSAGNSLSPARNHQTQPDK